MDDSPEVPELTPGLKWLRALVMALLVTMIGGVITITAVLVTRMPDGNRVPLPESVTLPDGAKAEAVTVGRDYLLVLTTDGRVLVYGRDGAFRKALVLE